MHLATGQIGKPGAGPFSLTGQPNAMGGREVGGMANLLCAHRDPADAEQRAEVARLWGVDQLPARPGKTAVEMFDALGAGEIKIVWIACTNPAQSLPAQKRVHEALARAELVIVQDAYRDTETARHADVLLPAASWGEKEGTVTNSERHISRVRAAVPPPGEARTDWAIAAEFARRLEVQLRPGRPTLFPYSGPAEVFDEHRETTRGRDLDITGLSYRLLEERGPQQWPFPEGSTQGKARLYGDGVFPTASGRARFVATAYRAPAENADARYPLRLTTGRLRDQWHAMSRTGNVASLFAHAPEARLALHPADLERHGLGEGALARVASRRGELYVMVEADEGLRPGLAYLPMHWGARFLGGSGMRGVNELTLAALDPSSKQPELKHCAIRVERADLAWRLVAFGRASDATAQQLFERLDPFRREFPFASRTLAGDERPGVLLRLAARETPDGETLARIDRAFGLGSADALRYDDASRSIGRRIALASDGRSSAIRAVRLSGDTRSERWLHDYWRRGAAVEGVRRFLAVPLASPPGVQTPSARTLCVCHGVTEQAVKHALIELPKDSPDLLAALQAKLKCGTECGSCMPELRGLVAQSL